MNDDIAAENEHRREREAHREHERSGLHVMLCDFIWSLPTGHSDHWIEDLSEELLKGPGNWQGNRKREGKTAKHCRINEFAYYQAFRFRSQEISRARKKYARAKTHEMASGRGVPSERDAVGREQMAAQHVNSCTSNLPQN